MKIVNILSLFVVIIVGMIPASEYIPMLIRQGRYEDIIGALIITFFSWLGGTFLERKFSKEWIKKFIIPNKLRFIIKCILGVTILYLIQYFISVFIMST